MKKLGFLILFASAAVALSCSKEGEIPGGNDDVILGGEITLTASIENGELGTKSTFEIVGEEGSRKANLLWTKGDRIGVFTNKGLKEFSLLDSSHGAGTGTFRGTLDEDEDFGDLAYYPHNAAHTAAAFTLPAAYGDASAAHAANTNAALAAALDAEAETIGFKYLSGVVCVKFGAVPAGFNQFVFTAAGGNIAGAFSVVEEDGNKVIKTGEGQGTGSSVTFNFAPAEHGQSLEFNIPMPLGTYSSYTFSLKNTVTGREYSRTNVKDRTVERAKLIVIDASNVVPEYDVEMTEEWTKTGSELGLVHPNAVKDIAVYWDYLLVLDTERGIPQRGPTETKDGTESEIRVLSKSDGVFLQNTEYYEGGWLSLYGWMWALACDEDGNFCAGVYNVDAAGCRIDVYKKPAAINAIPVPINPAAPAAGLGRRLQVLGNLASGEGIIVSSSSWVVPGTEMTNSYGVMKLQDGAPETTGFTMVPTGYKWRDSIVQRESLSDETMYIAYTDETGYPNHADWNAAHGANFVMQVPGQADITVPTECFDYRILDMEVFWLGGKRYMASLQQTYSTGTGDISLQIHDFTDAATMDDMTPSAEGFNDFRPCRIVEGVRANDGRYGSIDVEVREDGAYIYTYIPGDASNAAEFKCRKMTYSKIR